MNTRWTALIAIALAGLTMVSDQALSYGEDTITPEKSKAIIKKIQHKYEPIYKKFQGIEQVRHVTMKEYDVTSNKLLSTSILKVSRKDYFYDTPEVKILSYIKDGKETKPQEFRQRKQKPMLPIFDRQGPKNYRVTCTGYKIVNGIRCYWVQVDPREDTERHFKGHIYFNPNTLDHVGAEGTMAKLAYPIKKIWMKFTFTSIMGIPAVETANIEVKVHVPVFYPNRKLVSRIKGTNSRPIR
jgi:hypothetical protein